MFEEAPDAGEIDAAPSRAKRAFARAKIAVALMAPVIGLAALFLIARSSGDADAGQLKDAPIMAASVAAATATPVPTTPEVGFTNHWLS